jgi:hypothetical protein
MKTRERSPRSAGHRYPLRLYRHIMRLQHIRVMLLAIMLLGLWLIAKTPLVSWMPADGERWLLAGGLVATAYWLFIAVGPLTAYVQPRADHLRLQTPIYRLNISYQRIRSTRPIDVAQLLPPTKLTRYQQRVLGPFLGDTALGINLTDWPLPRWVLRLFLSRWMLANDQLGLIVFTEDWMSLSHELTEAMNRWRDDSGAGHQGKRIAAEILDAEKARRRRLF